MRVVLAGNTLLDSSGRDAVLPKALDDGVLKLPRSHAIVKLGEAHKVNVTPHLSVLFTHKNDEAWRRYALAGLKGDTDAAKGVVDELAKLPPSSVGSAEALVLRMFDEGSALAQLGSVNMRVERVPEDVAKNVCEAMFDEHEEPNLLNVVTAAAVNVAMRLMNFCSAGAANATSFDFAEVARGIMYPSRPQVLFPSLENDVYVTVYPAMKCSATSGKRFVMGVQSNLDFLRQQAWGIFKSFLFLYASDDIGPLDLELAFDRFRMNFAAKQIWARHAALHFETNLSPKWSRDGAKFLPPSSLGFYILVSWDEALHKRLVQEVHKHIVRTGRLDSTRKSVRFVVPGVEVGREGGAGVNSARAAPKPSVRDADAAKAVADEPLQSVMSLAHLFENDIGREFVDKPGKSAFNMAMGVVQDKYVELVDNGSVDDMYMSEQLCALGFTRSHATGGLFASVAYFENNGFFGMTLMSLVRAFLSEVARAPEGAMLVGGIGEDAKFGELTSVSVDLRSPNPGGSSTRTVGVLRFADDQWSDSEAIVAAIEQAIGKPGDGVMRLYHGTSIEKATQMLEMGGVDTRLLEATCDFGQGLSTSPQYECAHYYSFTRLSGDQAVMIFDVDQEKFDQMGSMPDLRKDLEKWKQIVTAFRDGAGIRALPREIQMQYLAADYLQGPISGTEHTDMWPWTQVAFFSPHATSQMLTETEGGLVRSITVVRLTRPRGY
eukprot:m.12444 g.12444  ORF g.12444 m.12444 type:complete len:718 (+) comp2947_c0_seq1:293-2446(+)